MKTAINQDNLDLTVDPRQDFYKYACGGWQKNHPLDGEYSQFGTFNVLAEEARDNVRSLIETLSDDSDAGIQGTIVQKISDLYAMGMDIERRNKEGNAPMRPVLERIENFTKENLAETVAWLSFGLDSTFFGYGVGPDPGNSNLNMLHLMEAGLGLGDRDYYLEKNETNHRILNAYREYIRKVMSLSGYDSEASRRISDTVIEIETEYARHKKTREERRDPILGYNVFTIERLISEYPNFPWSDIFILSGISEPKRINVSSPKFMAFINEYYPTLTERQIKDLMAFGAVSSSTGVLGEEFYDADFEMFSRVMSGVEEKKPLWKRAMAIPNSMFGEAVGQLYVKKYFPKENKEYMVRLVENLRGALGKHIRSLSWMSDSTKEKALEKLESLKVKIGYPDKGEDYSEIQIDPDKSYMENVLAASEWFTRDNYSKMDKPVDKEEWYMTPQTVNAYYSPLTNEICFPAGILQPPFFDINADDAQNYGAIGVVIGHEMTHGFDDSGRKYDKNGNLVNCWTKEDEEQFKLLTDRLEKQFDDVEVAPGVHANGKFTLGENIADQGGLRVALSAYEDSRDGKETDKIDGFSALQRFYLAYAGVWASNIRPEEILVRTQSDPHSLAENRVNVTLRNLAPFMNAFGIKEGDSMFRKESDRVIIW